MKTVILALATTAALAAPVGAAPPRPGATAPEEARIPFPNHGGIRNFEAVSNDVLYIQDAHRNWYRAQLFGPCLGLSWAFGIGIDTRGSSSFDRFSTLLVRGERCPMESLTRSGPPPRKRPKNS